MHSPFSPAFLASALASFAVWCLAGPGPTAAESPAASFEPIEFEARDGRTVPAERGTLRVPENRSDPDSRTIELAFVRFAATTEEPGPPIVLLAGGPGGSGIGAARGHRFELLMGLRELADVVAFDQRGTGESEPEMGCGDGYSLPLDRPLDRGTAGATLAVAARSCADRLAGRGIDLGGYTTVESVDDLDDLRRTLGAERLILMGSSYGSHLALATVDRHGERIDRIVLSGLEPLHHTWKLPSNQQRLLERIAVLAQQDPDVRRVLPDLLGTIDELLRRFRTEPVRVAVEHPTEGTMEIVLGELDFQRFLAGMLRGPDEFRAMPDAVARMADGDFLGLAIEAARFRRGEMWNAMSLAMDCASGMSGEWATRIAVEARRTLLADAINFPYPEVCAGVPVDDLGEAFRDMETNDTPALLLSGSLDGRTPPSNAEEVVSRMPNAIHFVIRGAGHSDDMLAGTEELEETVHAFLRGEEIGERSFEVERPPFLSPRKVVTLPGEILERYVGTYRIGEGDERRVIRTGDQLWTQRGEGAPFPIRPTSATEFFYEGSATFLRFQVDEGGRVLGMEMYHDGGREAEEAVKVPPATE